MVMSKAVVDARVDEQAQLQPVVDVGAGKIINQDGWHTSKGKPNISAQRILDTIMEYLDSQEYDVCYSDIQKYLIETIPDDCFEYGDEDEMGNKPVTWQISTVDIKGFVAMLVEQGLAVDQ